MGYPVGFLVGMFTSRPTIVGICGTGLHTDNNRTAKYSILTGSNSDSNFITSVTAGQYSMIIVFTAHYMNFIVFTFGLASHSISA